MTDRPQPTLTTERLTLRPFRRDDAEQVRTLAGNPAVSSTTLRIPYPYERGMAETWIDTHRPAWNAGLGLAYAITLTDAAVLVGAVGLHDIEGKRAALGYWIAEPHWRKGYCTEAARALIRFSFESLDLDLVHAEHLAANPASGKVMQKLGMRYIGSARKPDRNGRLSSMELYELRNGK